MENRACFSSIVISNRHFQHLADLDKNETLQKLAVKYWTILRGRFLFRSLKKHVKTRLNGLNGNRRFSRLPPFMMNSSQSKQRIKWYQNSPGNKFVHAGVLLFARVSSHSFSPLFLLPFHSYFFFFFFFWFSNSIAITMLVKSGHCDDVHPPGYFLTRRSFLFFFCLIYVLLYVIIR